MTLENKLMFAMYNILQRMPHDTTHGDAREKSPWCRKGCLACEWEDIKKLYSRGTKDGDSTRAT